MAGSKPPWYLSNYVAIIGIGLAIYLLVKQRFGQKAKAQLA
jgi:hypothetical protein